MLLDAPKCKSVVYTRQIADAMPHLQNILQRPLVRRLLVTLNLVPDHKVLPVFERDTALGILAHGLDVLFLVLDIIDET